ncbi:MAG: SagB/ThcOx family dehydrogenase [Candidatus Aminicenantes bacterium]|nr:SagB/ThcOx family dehydrogenase [Candidatus Aminicenantes bacterium]
MTEEIGRLFQEKTKYRRGQLSGLSRTEKWPGRYKRYPQAPRLSLPSPAPFEKTSLWECLSRRRSVRQFSSQPLSLETLSLLLWACQGITAREFGFELRAAPSAGALYPIETYLSVHQVKDLEPGIYHYDVSAHALEKIKSGHFGQALARAALDQSFVAEAAVVFIWTALFARSTWKYRQRAYRYIYLDAGHLAENLALAAVACKLGSCQIGAFYDEEVNALLGLDGREESTIYLSAVGLPL